MADIWAPLAQGQVPRRYRPGQFIYLQGTQPQYFYYLLQGAARSFISSREGAERVLTVYHAGDLMGEASFFDGCPRVSSAVAVEECLAVLIDQPRLETCFERHPELALPMLRYLSRTVRVLSGHVDGISFQSAAQRLAGALLRQGEGECPIRFSHEELGALIGTSRVTVSRTLSQFVRNGWIKTGYRTLSILDRAALERFARSEEEGAR